MNKAQAFVKKHPWITAMAAVAATGAAGYGATYGIPPEATNAFLQGLWCAFGLCG